MPLPNRRGLLWCCALLVPLMSGCFNVSQNSSTFPHYFPFGHIFRTHAKPAGPGYFSDFDKHAARIEIIPLHTTSPLRAEVLLIASVVDEKGQGRKGRRVEWLVEGQGHLIEVDESGLMPGRGYKVDNRYGVSYTDHRQHTIKRRTGNPADDVVILPGQAWCIVSSATEGDMHVTAYAPEVGNHAENRAIATVHWGDATRPGVRPPPPLPADPPTGVIPLPPDRPLGALPGPDLKVTKTGPATAAIGTPITYQITVANTGTGLATNVVVKAEFDPGLVHESGSNSVELPIGSLAAGQSRTVGLTLTPQKAGPFTTRVALYLDRTMLDRAENVLTVQSPRLGVKISGPPWKYAERTAEFSIAVSNLTDEPLTGIELRQQLPSELQPTLVTDNGKLDGNAIVWAVGNLGPRQQKVVRATTACLKVTPRALTQAVASAGADLRGTDEAALEIRGLPSFQLSVVDLKDPVEVGGTTTYKIDVSNRGTLDGNQLQIVAQLPPEMQLVKATGPTPWRQEGTRVIFQPMDGLQPKGELNYALEVKALAPGGVVCHVELSSATLTKPIVEEEPTRISPASGGTRTPGNEPPLAPPRSGEPPLAR